MFLLHAWENHQQLYFCNSVSQISLARGSHTSFLDLVSSTQLFRPALDTSHLHVLNRTLSILSLSLAATKPLTLKF